MKFDQASKLSVQKFFLYPKERELLIFSVQKDKLYIMRTLQLKQCTRIFLLDKAL